MEYRFTNKGKSLRVSEAAVEYIAAGPGEAAVATISSKNQITLPVHLLREMGLGAGDRLAISVEGSHLVLRPRPKDWVKYHAGSLGGLYGKDAGEVRVYIEDLRSGEERDDAVEGAWSGSEPAPKQ